MIYLKNGKVQLLPHEKTKPWGKKLKASFGQDFQAILDYIYFAYGRESHIKNMLIQDRKAYAFNNLSGFKKYDTFVEVEDNTAFKECIADYNKTMRTKTEQRILRIEDRIDELQEMSMNLNIENLDDSTKINKSIDSLYKQVSHLKKTLIQEESQNIRAIGITLFEIPDENVKLL